MHCSAAAKAGPARAVPSAAAPRGRRTVASGRTQQRERQPHGPHPLAQAPCHSPAPRIQRWPYGPRAGRVSVQTVRAGPPAGDHSAGTDVSGDGVSSSGSIAGGKQEQEEENVATEGVGSSPTTTTTTTKQTLASLDSLLGTTQSSQPPEDHQAGRAVAEEPPSSTGASALPPTVPESGQPEAEDGLEIPRVSPRVSYLMLALNLTVYGIGAGIALAGDAEGSNSFFLSLACDHSAVASGEYYRLLTSTFMHAGLLHLGLNCAAILSVAPEAEAVLGYPTFAFIYLASGLSGSVASFLLTDSVTVGASGAIFGILGALIAYFARNPRLQKARFQLVFLLIVAALNLGIGLDGGGLVDNSGHVAGLVAGGWLGFGMGPRWQAAEDAGEAGTEGGGNKGLQVVNLTPRAQAVTVALSFASSLPVLVAVGVAAQMAEAGQ